MTSGDGYYQTLSGLKVVDGFARDFIGMVNGTAPGSVPVTVVYAGHSLGGYLSTVIGALRGGRAYSFNGPGVTAEKIRALAQDLQLPQLPALGGDFAEGASRNITTTVLSSDLIGNLGAHEGTLITVRNGDSPFGRNREAMRWLMHELHAKVDTRVGKQPPAATDAAAFNHLGAPELGLDPAATYRKTFHAVALEQHSIKHLVRLLESLEPMAGLVHVHALPLPSPFAAEAPGAGSRAQEAVEDAYHSASRAHRLQATSDQALPFAGDELADEATPEQTR